MKALFETGAVMEIDSTQQNVISPAYGCNTLYPIIEDQDGAFYIMLENKAYYFTVEDNEKSTNYLYEKFKDLKLTNKDRLITYHRNPTKSEISFGYGAVHYRDFIAAEIGLNSKGELKKWFVADDGLRYYY